MKNNELRTIQPRNLGKIKNSQPEPQFTGSYRKKECNCSVLWHMAICTVNDLWGGGEGGL